MIKALIYNVSLLFDDHLERHRGQIEILNGEKLAQKSFTEMLALSISQFRFDHHETTIFISHKHFHTRYPSVCGEEFK